MHSSSDRPAGQSPVRFLLQNRLFQCGLAAASLLLGFAPQRSQAADAALFLPDEPSQIARAAVPAADRGVRRSRFARINPQILSDAASPLRQPSPAALHRPGSRLGLGLFTDRNVTAVIERTDYKGDGRFTASGVVDGVPGSHVLVSGDGETLAATVFTPGADVAQIVYAGDGQYKIAELDPVESTSCGTPLPPPTVGGDGSGPVPVGDTTAVVDVMVLYTAAARVGAGGVSGINSQIDLAVAEANTCYSNSGINATLNLVYRGEISYTETSDASTDLGRLQAPSDGKLDSAQTLRAQYGADLVCLVVEAMDNYAGLGYLMSTVSTNFASSAYSVVKRQYLTGALTFPHELGHNMGCHHDRQNATGSGAYSYSYGYRFDVSGTTYRTVMAYAPGTRIPYFSNPDVNYLGTPTGVALGDSVEAANALSISNNLATVAAFFDSSTFINFTTNAVSVAENGTNVVLTLERTGVVTNSASIKVSTVAGTAKANTDYTTTTTTVTFASGETNKTVSIPIINDSLAEANETFTVTLSSPTNAVAGANTPLTVTITEDDVILSLTAATANVLESATNVVLSLTRTGATNGTVSVDYATTAVTATSDTDYTNSTGTVTFSPGVTSGTITVPIINDTNLETSETFKVVLSSPTNATLGTITNTTVTILEDDMEFIFGTPLVSALESAGTATVSVWRRGGSSTTNTVDYASTTNSTATAASDFTAPTGTLTFKPGVTNMSFAVTLLNDTNVETAETIELALSNPSGNASLASSNTTSTITINDTDSTFNFAVVTNSVAENAGTLTLNVTRTGGTGGAATVDFLSSTNGTATSGTDFAAAAGKLSFKAGETNKTIVLKVTNDSSVEGDETLTVTLKNPTGEGQLGTNSVAQVTITDDDLYSFTLTTNAVSVAENGTNVVFTVIRSGATNATSVKYATTAGTAKAGADFVAATGTLNFADGETTNTVTVTITDDTVIEPNETFIFALNTPATNGVLGAITSTTVTITENDAAISLAAATYNVLESATNVVLTLNRTGATNADVSVNFATTNLTATSDVDYTNSSGTVTISAGATSGTITVPIINDTNIESSETFKVVLSSPTNAALGSITNATVTIIENDVEFLFGTPLVSVAENAGVATVSVWRRGGSSVTNSVQFAVTTNGTATAASDFISTNGTLTFKPGITNLSFTVALLNDTNVESAETIEIALSSPSSGTALASSNNASLITINDTDSVFDFAAVTNSVAENAGTLTLNVTRTGGTGGAATVDFLSSTNGTATSGTDFAAAAGKLSFKAGETNKTIVVKITNDSSVEGDENFTVTLKNPTGEGQLGTNSVAQVTITDDDLNSFTLTTNAVSVAENGTNVVFTVIRSGATNATSVKYATTAGTAKAGADFVAASGTLNFASGETTNTVTVTITDDTVIEPNETFIFALNTPATNGVLGAITSTTVTITENDAAISLAAATYTVLESATNVVLTLTRTGATNADVSVNFATVSTNLTATADSDYTATNGTITISAGSRSNVITVPIINDTNIESSETFRVVLSSPTNAVLGAITNALVTITENDVEFIFGTPLVSVAESAGVATVSVWRRGGTTTTNTVQFAVTTNGTATAASDFVSTNGTLTFKPGVTNVSFTVALLNDTNVETAETIELALSNPSSGTSLASSNTTSTITINDTDSVFDFAVVTNSVAENAGTLTLNVTRTGGTGGAATVDFLSSTNGTATSGTDFAAAAGKLSFKAGETNKTIVVKITNDSSVEGDETLTVTLKNPTGEGQLGTNSVAQVTITDDDLYSFTLTTNAVSVAENGTNVVFTVIRSGGTNATSVKYATTSGTAKAGVDFVAASGTLNFASGETTNTVTVTITDDSVIEPNEAFIFALNTPATNGVLGAITSTTVTITENDSAISLAAATYNVLESATNVVLTLNRTGATNADVSVNFATTAVTATSDVDYTNSTGTVTFSAGVTSGTITVPIINDTNIETSETFKVVLSSPTNALVGAISNSVVTILEDDVEFIFGTPLVSVAENIATATVSVWRRGGTTVTNTVDYATTTNGTATAASDFTAGSGTLTFKTGVTNVTFTVALLNDTNIEGNETIEVALSNPSSGTSLASSNTTSTITIQDNDSLFNFSVVTNTVAENIGNVTLTVTRTGGVIGAAAVTYTTANDTATNALDYTAASKALSFKAGETNKSFTIKILNDIVTETNETFTVTLSAPTGEGQLGTNNVAYINITDNDADMGGDVADQHRLTIHVQEDGSRVLTVVGEPRARITIEGSSDFVQWTALKELEFSKGSVEWTDQDTSEEASTTYRIWIMPGD